MQSASSVSFRTTTNALFCFTRVLGDAPKDSELDSYLEAYFGDRLSEEQRGHVISKVHTASATSAKQTGLVAEIASFLRGLIGEESTSTESESWESVADEATTIASLLMRSTEEMDAVVEGLSGGYLRPAPGGGTLRVAVCGCIRTMKLNLASISQTCFAMGPVCFQPVVTSTRLIHIVCRAPVHGHEDSEQPMRSSGNTRSKMMESFQRQ